MTNQLHQKNSASLRLLATVSCTVVAVTAMAWVGLMSGRGPGHVPAVWWANAVLLAVMLLSPRSYRWSLIFAGYMGNVLAHLLMHDPLSQVMLLSLCDTAEATFALITLKWNSQREQNQARPDLTNRSSLFRFVIFGVLLSPLLAALFAGAILRLLVHADIFTALRWFPPSALGMAIVTPLLLSLTRRDTWELSERQRTAKTILYLSLLAVTALSIFTHGDLPLLYMLYPPLMFLVVELGVGGGSLGACTIAAIGSIYIVHGNGTLALGLGSTQEQRILIFQMLLATAVLSVNVVGLVLGDLQRSASIAHTASLRLAGALRSLEDVAHLDPTTHVANRRRLDEVLHAEWQRATRDRLPLSFLLMDVDHFKSYNDRYGHLAGDECLRVIAQIVASVVHRSADVVARFGGEEFAIVLPNTCELGAREIASKVRVAICSASIAHEDTSAKFVTLSIGCATALPVRDTSVTTLVAAADEALYQAKREGRDRIVTQAILSPAFPTRVLT